MKLSIKDFLRCHLRWKLAASNLSQVLVPKHWLEMYSRKEDKES